MGNDIERIENEILSWSYVTAETHRFGGLEFRFNKRLLTTIFNTDVPSFILLVTAATVDNAVNESNQPVLKTMWSFTLNESYPRDSAFLAIESNCSLE